MRLHTTDGHLVYLCVYLGRKSTLFPLLISTAKATTTSSHCHPSPIAPHLQGETHPVQASASCWGRRCLSWCRKQKGQEEAVMVSLHPDPSTSPLPPDARQVARVWCKGGAVALLSLPPGLGTPSDAPLPRSSQNQTQSRGGPSPVPAAGCPYTMPSLRLLLHTTSAVISKVTRMGSRMKGQRMPLGGSCSARPEGEQFLKYCLCTATKNSSTSRLGQ